MIWTTYSIFYFLKNILKSHFNIKKHIDLFWQNRFELTLFHHLIIVFKSINHSGIMTFINCKACMENNSFQFIAETIHIKFHLKFPFCENFYHLTIQNSKSFQVKLFQRKIYNQNIWPLTYSFKTCHQCSFQTLLTVHFNI